MLTTRRLLATALLALATGSAASAQAAQRTGLGDMAVTRQYEPGIARTGLGDVNVTRSDTDSRPPLRVATRTPARADGALSRCAH